MKILLEINDADLGIGNLPVLGQKYELRKSARAILLNDEGLMAGQLISKHNFHKLPGGGLDNGETIEDGLKREVREEVGCECEIIKSLGMAIEFREKYELIQISYGFVARVVGEIKEPTLEQAEIDEGLTHIWIKPEEMMAYLNSDTTENYSGQFILPRERAFMEEFLRLG